MAQIRAGFLEAEAAHERVRRFRLERVARILAGETPIPTRPGPKVIFHALPLASLDVWPTFVGFANEKQSQIPNLFKPMAGAPNNWPVQP